MLLTQGEIIETASTVEKEEILTDSLDQTKTLNVVADGRVAPVPDADDGGMTFEVPTTTTDHPLRVCP